jgi:hypothetical protein
MPDVVAIANTAAKVAERNSTGTPAARNLRRQWITAREHSIYIARFRVPVVSVRNAVAIPMGFSRGPGILSVRADGRPPGC